MGLVHIYCGDGKGKTTAALGLALRASGNDMKVLIVQFLKGMDTSEEKAIAQISNIELIKDMKSTKFTFQMSDDEIFETRQMHNKSLDKAIKKSENIDILILDEIISTYNLNLVDRETVLNFLKNRPENLEIILTGREPSEELCIYADYISEIACKKHPYEKGITARKGIEF